MGIRRVGRRYCSPECYRVYEEKVRIPQRKAEALEQFGADMRLEIRKLKLENAELRKENTALKADLARAKVHDDVDRVWREMGVQ